MTDDNRDTEPDHSLLNAVEAFKQKLDDALRLQQMLDELSHVPGVPEANLAIRRVQVEQLLGLLTSLSADLKDTSKKLAIQAISEGTLSRKRAAEILEVHQNTTGRWMKKQQAERKKQKD